MPIKNRAETPEQKRQVIERLYAAWLANPDSRLCQLIMNATHPNPVFYIEDMDLVTQVEKFINKTS